MAARRGKSQARRNHGARGIPPWIWLLAGLLLGLAVAAWVLVRDGFDARRLLPQPNPAAEAPREPEVPVAQKADPAATRRPTYDFYTVLRESEVQIPDAEIADRARTDPPAVLPAGEQLSLQAGSFSDLGRAEKIKAQIAFTGLIARVEPTTTSGGATVHRVMLGPYASMRELEAARQALAGGGIEAIAIRQPAESARR